MKPKLLKVHKQSLLSFSVRQDMMPNINNKWHYHPEIELIYFHKGSGTQFIGDSIRRFEPGNIVLVGSNLPHYWKYDEQDDNHEESPYSTVIHFFDDFWGQTFLNLPENNVIKNVLEKAKRGIQISASKEKQIAKLIEHIAMAKSPIRILLLMETLTAIGMIKSEAVLSSIGFKYNLEESDRYRINQIYDYSIANFKEKILLEKVADLANLTTNSFCRYFKTKTQKTYMQFINEIRIGQACRLLIEDEINIKQVCYESGFNNSSSFHTTFKSITGKTPLMYKQNFISKQ
jgi:AraC-like DNA-binding protein